MGTIAPNQGSVFSLCQRNKNVLILPQMGRAEKLAAFLSGQRGDSCVPACKLASDLKSAGSPFCANG